MSHLGSRNSPARRNVRHDDRRPGDLLLLLQATRTWGLLVLFLVLAGYGIGQL